MTFRIALLLAAVVAAFAASAQTRSGGTSATEAYHRGAQLFVDGEDASALAAVDAGLAASPGNAKLQALRELIQQNQDDSESEDENQDSENGESDESQDSQDGDESEEGDESQDGEGEDESEDARPPEAAQDGTATQPPPQTGDGQAPAEAAEMTAAQADRLLDAVGGEERLLMREMRRQPTQRRRSDKDW